MATKVLLASAAIFAILSQTAPSSLFIESASHHIPRALDIRAAEPAPNSPGSSFLDRAHPDIFRGSCTAYKKVRERPKDLETAKPIEVDIAVDFVIYEFSFPDQEIMELCNFVPQTMQKNCRAHSVDLRVGSAWQEGDLCFAKVAVQDDALGTGAVIPACMAEAVRCFWPQGGVSHCEEMPYEVYQEKTPPQRGKFWNPFPLL